MDVWLAVNSSNRASYAAIKTFAACVEAVVADDEELCGGSNDEANLLAAPFSENERSTSIGAAIVPVWGGTLPVYAAARFLIC